jgi:hypothetical protein
VVVSVDLAASLDAGAPVMELEHLGLAESAGRPPR